MQEGPAAEAHADPRPVRMHPVLLRFDDAARERAFRRAHDRASLPTVRLAASLGIFLYAVFAVLDTQIAREGVAELLLMRAVVIACLALALAATFRPWFGRVQQTVVCGAVLAAGLGMASMPLLADVPDAMPAMGTMLTLIFLFSFVRARIVPASITALLVIAGFELSLVASGSDALTNVFLNFELLGFVVVGAVACHTLERLWRRDYLRTQELERERERSDSLLHNVLPETIARRLRLGSGAIAEAAEEVTVLFADIVDFTPLTERTDPHELVAVLDRLFSHFDALCDRHACEKIKTIGDGYMAVAGIPDPHPDAAAAIVDVALGMRGATAAVHEEGFAPLDVRVGICTGPALAGVIGRRRFAYDLWGDTVNTASRLESHGARGAITICGATRDRLKGRYRLSGPVCLDLKGKGRFEAYEVVGPAAGQAAEAGAPHAAVSAGGTA